jgi:hypothetical protein
MSNPNAPTTIEPGTSIPSVPVPEVSPSPVTRAPAPPTDTVVQETPSEPVPPVAPLISIPGLPDLASNINIVNNAYVDNGSKIIIDVIPDMRNCIKALIFYVAPMYSEFNLKDTASASPLSIMAYLHLCIHAYLLHNDHLVRSPRSANADAFMTTPSNKDYFDSLLNMKVPPFMKNLLMGMFPTADSRRSGVKYISSLAAFNFEHDFPRVLTPGIFLAAHNIVSSASARTEPHLIYNQFYGYPVVNYAATNYTIGQLLGTNVLIGTQLSHFPNWLNEAIDSLFNPVVMRNLQNRPFFTRVPFAPPTFTRANINPYVYLLCADRDNIESMTSFVDSMSKFFGSHSSGSVPLGSIIKDLSGNSILVHSTSIVPLPTWTTLPTATPSAIDHSVTKSKTDFANVIKYLTKTAPPPPGSNFTIPAPSTSGFIGSFYSIIDKKFSPKNDPDSYITFDSYDHVSPMVRFFDPTDTSVSKLIHPIISGIKIETFEIDDFGVPLPNSSIPLEDENSFMLQSCLPLEVIYPADHPISDIVDRTPHRSDAQPVSVSLYDMTVNYLRSIASNAPGPVPAAMPGFTNSSTPVNMVTKMFNKFGFNIGSSPLIGSKRFHVWSSYRYMRSLDGDNDKRIFMLLSFRPIYGTNVTLVQTKFPPSMIKI